MAKKHSSEVVESLKHVLADSYVLYLKTQNYHWNVTGSSFHSYHAMFEQQYRELAEAIDEIAERIRALGEKAPGSFEAFSEYTNIDTNPVEGKAVAMVEDLLDAHATLIATLKDLQHKAGDSDDPETEDIAIGRLATHEKTVWMLKATIE